MITEDYVSFETAKLLKEKGFDEKCRTYYKVFPENRIAAIYHSSENRGISEDDPNEILCPTLQMVMKWLREVHYIHITALCPIVDVDTDIFGVKYNVVISNLKNYCLAFDTSIEDNEYDTYEQACEAAIKYCLENLI